jgi:hypothetical protein
VNQNPTSVPALLHDKYEFFAELAARFRAQTQLEAVLVGGSAFEWHFPSLHASEDLDIVIQAALPRTREFEKILIDFGYVKTGRCWASPAVSFTVEIVGSTLALAPGGVGADVVVVQAPQSGKAFTLLTATMMWCDRAMAWEALPHSERDARHTLLAIRHFSDKIDFRRARQVLRAAGILRILRQRVKSIPEWNGLEMVFNER